MGNAVALYDDGLDDDAQEANLPALVDEDDGPSRRDTIRGAIDLQRESRGEPARYHRESREVAPSRSGNLSQAAFDRLPPTVRGALTEYAPLAPYANLARQNGTSIAAAVQKYNQLENLMAVNPVAGIEVICNVMRIPLHDLANALVDRCNRPHLYPAPESAMGQVRAHQEIARTAADTWNYPHFETLRQDMIAILMGGQVSSLHDAYHHAARARGLAGRSSGAAVRRARGAAKHISGSPGQSQGGEGMDQSRMSRRQIIRDAISHQQGY